MAAARPAATPEAGSGIARRDVVAPLPVVPLPEYVPLLPSRAAPVLLLPPLPTPSLPTPSLPPELSPSRAHRDREDARPAPLDALRAGSTTAGARASLPPAASTRSAQRPAVSRSAAGSAALAAPSMRVSTRSVDGAPRRRAVSARDGTTEGVASGGDTPPRAWRTMGSARPRVSMRTVAGGAAKGGGHRSFSAASPEAGTFCGGANARGARQGRVLASASASCAWAVGNAAAPNAGRAFSCSASVARCAGAARALDAGAAAKAWAGRRDGAMLSCSANGGGAWSAVRGIFSGSKARLLEMKGCAATWSSDGRAAGSAASSHRICRGTQRTGATPAREPELRAA